MHVDRNKILKRGENRVKTENIFILKLFLNGIADPGVRIQVFRIIILPF